MNGNNEKIYNNQQVVENQKPLKNFHVGSINSAVWEQQSETGKFLTVSWYRSFKTEDGFGKSQTLRISDIPDLRLALQLAYEFAKVKNEN